MKTIFVYLYVNIFILSNCHMNKNSEDNKNQVNPLLMKSAETLFLKFGEDFRMLVGYIAIKHWKLRAYENQDQTKWFFEYDFDYFSRKHNKKETLPVCLWVAKKDLIVYVLAMYFVVNDKAIFNNKITAVLDNVMDWLYQTEDKFISALKEALWEKVNEEIITSAAIDFVRNQEELINSLKSWFFYTEPDRLKNWILVEWELYEILWKDESMKLLINSLSEFARKQFLILVGQHFEKEGTSN